MYPARKDYAFYKLLSFLNMPTGLSNTCKLNPPKKSFALMMLTFKIGLIS